MKKIKLLFFVAEDWYFCSHRLQLAIAVREAGYDVGVVTQVNRHGDTIRQAGLRLIPFRLSRSGINLFVEFWTLARLIALFRREKPNIVHLVAMKPVLYGTLAAHIAGVPKIVTALAGLGYVFTSEQAKARILRPIISKVMRVLLGRPGSCLILQNEDDRATFIREGYMDEKRIALIKGSGVDTAIFLPVPEPEGIPVIVLASRMLWDKGIKEFVDAAEILKNRGVEARFVLAGDSDPHNPSAIPPTQLQDWCNRGMVEWWGYIENMSKALMEAHIVCLPSYYGEGVPKVLIESASCGRPIVTTDAPGCREIVRHGVNGLLVPLRDSQAIAGALEKLILDAKLRQSMGQRGREIVLAEFSLEKVVSATLTLYKKLIAL